MSYSKLKVAFTAISPQIAEHPGYSVALGILERLKVHGKSIGDNGTCTY